jgi:DMSO/TMAO reductase YedYZ molybdopterin-dependent catalytic subunit
VTAGDRYRWSFDLRDIQELLLATSVGTEPLSHEHGAPARLVAPGDAAVASSRGPATCAGCAWLHQL